MKKTEKTKEQLSREIDLLKLKIEELEKENEKYKFITENTSDNIAITSFDLKAKYLYVSPSITPVLGYEPEDLLGNSFFDFIHPDDKKALLPLLKKYLSLKTKDLLTGKKTPVSETIEFRFKNKAGIWRSMHSTINVAGKNLLAVTRDITEHKNAEIELQKHRDQLEELVKERTLELEKKNEDLAKYNKLFVGREFRIKELKDKVSKLEEKLKQ